jgi:hypothetical protein
MRIQNLKAPQESASPANPTSSAAANVAGVTDTSPPPASLVHAPGETTVVERQAAEIALLKARVQHLELVVETARALMGANQERLLRRLHELPRELVELTAQLRRIDPNAA